MRFLLDTHLLLWTAEGSPRLSKHARSLISDPSSEIVFSTVSIWEMAIKNASGKADFSAHPAVVRSELINAGFVELTITSAHAIAVGKLPDFHKDPFDRMLVAQAEVEGFTLLTADRNLARYPGVKRV